MKDEYGVRPLIMVVQHTFGRHLNFNAHLHMLVSAGGLSEAESHWIEGLILNPVGFMSYGDMASSHICASLLRQEY